MQVFSNVGFINYS